MQLLPVDLDSLECLTVYPDKRSLRFRNSCNRKRPKSVHNNKHFKPSERLAFLDEQLKAISLANAVIAMERNRRGLQVMVKPTLLLFSRWVRDLSRVTALDPFQEHLVFVTCRLALDIDS
jgi:hypothetical protein